METMTPEQAREKAQELFRSGCNCSQSVLCAVCGELGFDTDTALKIAQPFGGGMGRMREVCGAVSGMFMALGLASGSADTSDKTAKDETYKQVQQFAELYRTKNGSIICRELLGLVPKGTAVRAAENGEVAVQVMQQAESSERTPEYYKKRPCELLAGDAAAIFQTWYILHVQKE
jgi:C_GCAxxG_C_C family probable redox protein